MARDFITFGRTQLYYIDELYNIVSGIVEVLSPVYPAGESDPLDLFTLRCKVSPNTYSTVEVYRKDIRFDIENAKVMLINKLKEKYTSDLECNITVLNIEDVFEAFLFYKDDNIFEVEDKGYNIVENGVINFNEIPNYNKKYKVILKINDEIYSTPINDATVYNGDFKRTINFEDCEIIEKPEDYYSYIVHISDIPEELFNLDAKVIISNDKDDAETINQTSSNELTFNRFYLSNYNVPTISYYKPLSEYKLYLKIGTKTYLYREKASHFEIPQTFSFSNFEEVSNE